MTLLVPAEDASPADWLVDSLTPFGRPPLTVKSVVPAGFETYVRVFHPAALGSTPMVTWGEIAAANGRVAHAGMQLAALTGSLSFEDVAQPGVYDAPPRDGTLSKELAGVLADALERHTTTPRRCWFAVWEGFGGLDGWVREAPRFELPGFRHHLFAGPVDAATETFDAADWHMQSANLWWPDDHAWCVVTEVDFKSTYIGCSRAGAEDLLARRSIEAYEIDPATGVTIGDDAVNPRPAGLF